LGPEDAVFHSGALVAPRRPLQPFNVLVNYGGMMSSARCAGGFRVDALPTVCSASRALPPATRRAWAPFSEQYVFGDEAGVLEHISRPTRYPGTLSAEQLAGLRAHLRSG